jgi:hypothetical protein
MLMMMYIAFLKHRDLNNALMTIFYRDGIFYFICISGTYSGSLSGTPLTCPSASAGVHEHIRKLFCATRLQISLRAVRTLHSLQFFTPSSQTLSRTEVDIHVILATRMLLHLRRWAERERVGATANGRTPQTRSSFVCGSEEPVDYATSLDYWATDFGDADDVGYELARKDQKSPQSPSSSDHLV